LNVLVGSHPLVIVQVVAIATTTFVAMYVIGKRLGFKDHYLFMLGFGSAVCGASAIAVTAPVTETEPDDTAVGLVNNTIAVILCLGAVSWVLRPLMGQMEFAALAGSLLHQTGFVKMALAGAAKEVFTFGLAVKSLRIALLTISIPVVSFSCGGGFTFPGSWSRLCSQAYCFRTSRSRQPRRTRWSTSTTCASRAHWQASG
jgi:uncharacterized membrane protein YadS